MDRSNTIGVSLLAFVAGAVVWSVFGNRIKRKLEDSKDFQDLKKQVMDQASQITDITKERYDQIVEEVVNNYSKVRRISQNELMDLVADLKTHWMRMKRAWNE